MYFYKSIQNPCQKYHIEDSYHNSMLNIDSSIQFYITQVFIAVAELNLEICYISILSY